MVSHQPFDCMHTLPNFPLLMVLQQPENKGMLVKSYSMLLD